MTSAVKRILSVGDEESFAPNPNSFHAFTFNKLLQTISLLSVCSVLSLDRPVHERKKESCACCNLVFTILDGLDIWV